MDKDFVDLDLKPQAMGDTLANNVPVIDVSALIADPVSSRAVNAIDAIARACEEWGFFQVTGHGIPAQRIERVWSAVRAFFAQPVNEKEKILRTRDNPWGYYNNELTKNQRDRKEVFDYTVTGVDPIYQATNRWPSNPPQFRAVMEQHLADSTAVSLKLLRGFCLGLGLAPDFMEADFRDNHTGFMRLNYYPVEDPMSGRETPHLETADKGVHHHTDAGALTLLLQDEHSGLEAQTNYGSWEAVDPIPGTFVVNTGELLQMVPHNYFIATPHRVMNRESATRYSSAYFYSPDLLTRLDPLPIDAKYIEKARQSDRHRSEGLMASRAEMQTGVSGMDSHQRQEVFGERYWQRWIRSYPEIARKYYPEHVT